MSGRKRSRPTLNRVGKTDYYSAKRNNENPIAKNLKDFTPKKDTVKTKYNRRKEKEKIQGELDIWNT
jgi:hypothetical protein